MPIFPSLLIQFVCYLASLALTIIVRRILVKRAVLDRPNERSSHTIPTPRGGGWAIVAVVISGAVLAAWYSHTLSTYAPMLAGVALLAVVSWWDDIRGIRALPRLAAHLLAAALGTMSLPDHALLLGGVAPLWLDRTIMIIGWAWFINLYNFMDGIDGITSVETISLASGTCLVMSLAPIDNSFIEIMTLILTGASLGFLALNWHPAKIFLGDIGSIPLGYIVGFLLITLAANGMAIPALILPLYYLADSGITITKRALRGDKIWQAHREHFYQRAAAKLGRHNPVVVRIIVANVGLIGAALIAITHPWGGMALAVVVVALLLWWMSEDQLKKRK